MLARPSMQRAAASAMRSLRAPAQTTSTAAASTRSASPAPPSVPLTFSRTLVSTVLLSRDGYDSRKVTELKDELKKRGLSTTGRRDILVARLLEDDTRRAGSNSAAGAPVAARGASQRRNNASLASLRAANSNQNANTPPPVSPGTAGADAAAGVGNDKATVSHPPHIQPGQVSSTTNAQIPSAGFTEAPEKVVPDLNPPGVPPQKAASAPRAEFNIKIPYYEEPPVPGPEIPLVTAYFDPAHRTPHEEPVPLKTKKVLTVSAPETYPGGGVAHHAADFGDDSLDIDSSASSGGGKGSKSSSAGVVDEVVKAIRLDLGLGEGETKAEKHAVEAAGQAGASVGALAQGLVEDAKSALGGAAEKVSEAAASGASSTSSSSGGGSSSDHTRPLNADERSGALVLGALVAGGLLAGGLGKPSKKRVEEKRRKLEEIEDEIRKVEHGIPPSLNRIPSQLLQQDADLETLVRAAQEALRP